MHGALQLSQTAAGGVGGTGLGAIAGRGGDANSSLIDDDTANAPAHQSASISANVVASAGGGGFVGSDNNFGFGDGTPAAGGDATANATIIGAGPVVVSVRAFGGGGSLDNGGSAGNGGHGGLATAAADIVAGVETATTGGSNGTVTANGARAATPPGPGRQPGTAAGSSRCTPGALMTSSTRLGSGCRSPSPRPAAWVAMASTVQTAASAPTSC